MVVMVDTLDTDGYAYGHTERGREVVLVVPGRRIAHLARILAAAEGAAVPVRAPRALVLFADGGRR